jgi:hypothetical protein
LCIRGFARVSNQPSSWALEVELARETSPRLESLLDEALQPLDDALGLRIARLAEMPADPQLTAEAGERLARAAAAGVQSGLTVPDQRPRQRAQ